MITLCLLYASITSGSLSPVVISVFRLRITSGTVRGDKHPIEIFTQEVGIALLAGRWYIWQPRNALRRRGGEGYHRARLDLRQEERCVRKHTINMPTEEVSHGLRRAAIRHMRDFHARFALQELVSWRVGWADGLVRGSFSDQYRATR